MHEHVGLYERPPGTAYSAACTKFRCDFCNAQVNQYQSLNCLQDNFCYLMISSVAFVQTLTDSAFFSVFFCIQSMVAFLKDPSGPPLWEENPEAKDVVHIETEKVSNDLKNFSSFG